MKKIVLDIAEDIVIRVQELNDSVIQNVTVDYPYCSGGDLGNGYAVSLRRRDLYKSQSRRFQVVVLDKGKSAGSDYLYKKYDTVNQTFSLLHKDEQARALNVSWKFAGYRILSEGKNLYPSEAQQKEFISIYGEDFYKNLSSNIMKYITPSNTDLKSIEKQLDNLSEETRLVVINQIANALTGSDVLEHADIAIGWWDKLKGTSLEKRGLSAIAGIKAIQWKYDEAVAICDDLLKREDLAKGQKEEIEEKILAIGRGESLSREAVSIYGAIQSKRERLLKNYRDMMQELHKISTEGQPAEEARTKILNQYKEKETGLKDDLLKLCDVCLDTMDKFDEIATGRCAFFLGTQLEAIRAVVLSLKGRVLGKVDVIQEAIQILNNPKGLDETL